MAAQLPFILFTFRYGLGSGMKASDEPSESYAALEAGDNYITGTLSTADMANLPPSRSAS